MTLPLLARCPIGTILFFAALFLCADFSQSFAMTASATEEEKKKAKDGMTPKTVKAAKNVVTEHQNITRNNVIYSEFLTGDPAIYTPSFFSLSPRKITADKQADFDEGMKALAENQGCIRDTSDLSTTWDFGNNWSVGPAASVQLLRYETKSGKAAINAMGLGLGLSARFFSDDNIDAAALVRREYDANVDKEKKDKDESLKKWEAVRSIRRVHPDCRVSTFELTQTKMNKGEFYAKSVVSFGLFAFVSKEAEQDTVKVDPAFTVGFLQDLLTFGVGINTHGRNRGNAFLLLGIGSAFSLGD